MPFSDELYYHYYEGSSEGQRPPVVLVHGAGGNHLSWPLEMRRMRGYRVLAVDLPGHGKSGGFGLQSIEAYGGALLEWFARMNLHKAVVIGHSMGAAIALSLALNAPEHLSGLGVVGGAPRLKVNPQLIDYAASPTTYHNAIESVVSWSFSAAASPNFTDQVAQRMAATRPSVLHSDFLACDAWDETARIAMVGCSTLIVCGSEDRMTPLRHAQYLANTIPNARLEVIEGAGHMPQLEQPQVTANLVRDFLIDIIY